MPINLEKPKISKKLVTYLLTVFAISVILLVFVAYFYNIQLKKETSIPPEISPTPATEEIIAPSNYASDSAVLDTEEQLEILEKDLLKTDLYEANLSPPVLDMSVKFE